MLVSRRIDALKTERHDLQATAAALDADRQNDGRIDIDHAADLLAALPDLTAALANATPELRRRVFEAFRLSVSLDRNAGQIRLKVLGSSAFGEAGDLDSMVANGEIAGRVPNTNPRPPTGSSRCGTYREGWRSCSTRQALRAAAWLA
jgi:hypothetical protein